MALAKYHVDVYFPAALEDRCLNALRALKGKYVLSRHAKDRMFEKGVELPAKIPIHRCEIIEATVLNGELMKFLFRYPWTPEEDVVISINPRGLLITLYWNHRNDKHKTLRTNQYVRAA